MARTGRPTAVVVLTDEERETLERWARRPKSSQALALRCRIVLAAAEGRMNKDIAADLGCNPNTVGKWRARFALARLDGLHDEPRPGGPRSVTDADVERVIVKTLEETPRGATHWSTRSMAAEVGLSQTSISKIWRAFGLKPHAIEDFKLSPDPQFIDKVRDVVGLYLNPPEAAVVLCVDEKTSVQALDRTAPVLPLLPGVPERRTHDYKRNGTTNLFAALNVASGQVITSLSARHRAGPSRCAAEAPSGEPRPTRGGRHNRPNAPDADLARPGVDHHPRPQPDIPHADRHSANDPPTTTETVDPD